MNDIRRFRGIHRIRGIRALVLYHSRHGNTRYIAEAVAAATEADLVELPRQGRFEVPRSLEGYDLIFLGSPVRFGFCAAPIRTLGRRRCLPESAIAPFCCFSLWGGGTFRQIRRLFAPNRVLPGIAFRNPLRHDEQAEARRAQAWARQVLRDQSHHTHEGEHPQ